MHCIRRIIPGCTLLFLAALSLNSTHAEEAKLEAAKLGSTRNVHVHGSTYLCGQPSVEDFKLAKDKGIKVVLTLRGDGEIDWDEAAAVEALGLTYICIPFRGPDTLTDEVFDKSRKLLVDSGKEQDSVMMHCGSANRVGAIWLVHRVLDHGIELPVAQQEAKEVGLRAPELEARAIEYIQKHQGK